MCVTFNDTNGQSNDVDFVNFVYITDMEKIHYHTIKCGKYRQKCPFQAQSIVCINGWF